ncbi:uncharacterized protein LOC119160740 isoform X7 [Rhipicephalus microplus]|uniref:uncharacterized protein LOC119160740 isoform X7 n=1 Tax=Rhipicephalus microplus TaxID=6941 RepID=UPI003F6C73D0
MSEDNRETPGCSRVTCEGRAVCDGRITSDVLGGAPMLVAEQVRRLLQCLLHFVWWEWREDLLRKSSLQHHLQGLQFSVFPRRCGRKPRGTRSAVTAANGMMDGVFAANETGAPRGEGERLYPVFRDWSTALDSSAGEKTTTMAASSTATSRASWCRQATLQVREKEVRASGVKTSPTKFRMDSSTVCGEWSPWQTMGPTQMHHSSSSHTPSSPIWTRSTQSLESKLMELLSLNHHNRFMKPNHLFPSTMFGFGAGLSTQDVMLQLKEEGH